MGVGLDSVVPLPKEAVCNISIRYADCTGFSIQNIRDGQVVMEPSSVIAERAKSVSNTKVNWTSLTLPASSVLA